MKYRLPRGSQEYVLIPLREYVAPYMLLEGDMPEKIASYAIKFIITSSTYKATVENFYVVLLNTRKRILGHVHISSGTLDSLLVHARELFKPAIIADAAAIVLLHNHPSGETTPSEADVKVTRDMIRAGQLLKIDVMDHIVLGHVAQPKPYSSLRELGFFNS